MCLLHALYFIYPNYVPQPKEGGGVTEESHKQAVRKRRVRKDWEGEPHAYCLLCPPTRRRWKGRLCGCSPSPPPPPSPSGAARISSRPILQPAPLCYTSHRSAVSQTTSRITPPSRLLTERSDASPGGFVHLAVLLPPSRASTPPSTFSSSLSHCCQNACQPKEPHLCSQSPLSSLLSASSLNTRLRRSACPSPVRVKAAESVCTDACSGRSHHFTAYHRGHVSEVLTLFLCPLF